ncbi:MAG: hypothetical protein U0175_26950 [Caldilineaceae bacterium]
MKRSRHLTSISLFLSLCLLLTTSVTSNAQSAPQHPTACEEGTQSSGATYRICMPFAPTGKLIIYVQGYTAPNQPVALPATQIEGAGNLETAANLLGYALATSSFTANGLNVQGAIPDLVELVSIYAQKHGVPIAVILIGVSQGALTTVLALERHPEMFSGALAMCGPYGSFQDQINYLGDARVLFDHYFPGLTPGTPVDIPPTALDSWESTTYSTTVLPVVTNPANATKVDQFLAVSQAASDPGNTASKERTIERLLWYSVYATNDAKSKLGGQPFENQNRQYVGSENDSALNQSVLRFSADITATNTISNYETTGLITRPLVTMHTTGDPVVPYWHTTLLRQKTNHASNPNLHENRAITAYGHCQFSQNDVLSALNRLGEMIVNPPAPPLQNAIYLPIVSRE